MSDPFCECTPIKNIDLKTIDCSDSYYQLSVSNGFSDLCLSIEQIGLIHPPAIQKQPNQDTYRIINGFQRIQACQQLEMMRIPCYELPENVSSFTCAKRAVADNCHRTLNVLEQSRGLSLIEKTLPEHMSLQEVAGQLGLPVSQKAMRLIRPLCDMFHCIQAGISNDYIALPVAHKLAALSETDAQLITRMFEQLKPGLNIQREILTYCDEISKRDQLSFDDVLNHKQIRKIMSDDVDRKQKIHWVRMYLKSVRYPSFVEMETRVMKQIERLQLKTDIKLIPPPYFENNRYELHIGFNNKNALHQSLNDILSKMDTIDTILGTTK